MIERVESDRTAEPLDVEAGLADLVEHVGAENVRLRAAHEQHVARRRARLAAHQPSAPVSPECAP